jgi:hypothetical protein
MKKTNFMDHNPTLETDSSSAGQVSTTIYEIRKVPPSPRVHNTRPWTLSRVRWIQYTHSHSLFL